MASSPSTRSEPPPAVRWAGLIAAMAAICAVGVAIGLGLPLLSVIMERRGISASMIGLNTATAGLASIAAAPLAPYLARRFGVIRVMVASLVLAAFSALAFYAAEPFWTWFPLRMAFHGAITIVFILSEFWINDVAPAHRRGFVLGIYGTVLSLGFAAGPAIFSIIGSQGLLPFATGAAIILVSAIPIALAARDAPTINSHPTKPFLRYVWLVPTATAAVFVFGAVEAGGLAFFPVYAGQIGFAENQGALLLTAIGLGNVLFQIPIGFVADRFGNRRALLAILASIGLAGSLALPYLNESWWLLAGVLFVWGGVVCGLYTVGLTHLGATLKGADLASANAAFILCYAMGALIGPQTIGIAMDIQGPSGFATALGFFFLLYVGLSLGRIVLGPRRG
jgi:MFS family permease